jgi:hypothetical protein
MKALSIKVTAPIYEKDFFMASPVTDAFACGTHQMAGTKWGNGNWKQGGGT